VKVAPVSADLLIKLAIGAVLIGGLALLAIKGKTALTGLMGSLASLPGKAIDAVTTTASNAGKAVAGTAGAAWGASVDGDKYTVNSPAEQAATGKVYRGSMVTNDGMDFTMF
jgi:hypothetical protein